MCPSCWSEVLPVAGASCARCGGAGSDGDDLCLVCHDDPPPQAGTVVWGEYEGTLKVAVVALKHRGRDELAAPLGRRLAGRLASEPWVATVDLVTELPSHPVLRLRRGAIAAELLARRVADALTLPHRRLLRRRGVGRQAGRSRAQRLRLPANRLVPRARIDGLTVLVVDDVTTTGTTLRRAARALHDAGARAVYCAALARTPDPRRWS
jgi:predicted amidophosphoribosyltransferase